MNKTNLVLCVLEKYKQAQRHFQGMDMENGSFKGQNPEDIIFEDSSLYISFRKTDLRNAKLLNGGIITCGFREAGLPALTCASYQPRLYKP